MLKIAKIKITSTCIVMIIYLKKKNAKFQSFIMRVRAVLYTVDGNIKLLSGRRNSFGAHYTYFNPTTAAATTTGLAHEKNITRADWPTANNARSHTI